MCIPLRMTVYKRYIVIVVDHSDIQSRAIVALEHKIVSQSLRFSVFSKDVIREEMLHFSYS